VPTMEGSRQADRPSKPAGPASYPQKNSFEKQKRCMIVTESLGLRPKAESVALSVLLLSRHDAGVAGAAYQTSSYLYRLNCTVATRSGPGPCAIDTVD